MSRYHKTRSTAPLLGAVALLWTVGASGTELTHRFVNPNFGGNPLNGPFLLNSATLQNEFLDERETGPSIVISPSFQTIGGVQQVGVTQEVNPQQSTQPIGATAP